MKMSYEGRNLVAWQLNAIFCTKLPKHASFMQQNSETESVGVSLSLSLSQKGSAKLVIYWHLFWATYVAPFLTQPLLTFRQLSLHSMFCFGKKSFNLPSHASNLRLILFNWVIQSVEWAQQKELLLSSVCQLFASPNVSKIVCLKL